MLTIILITKNLVCTVLTDPVPQVKMTNSVQMFLPIIMALYASGNEEAAWVWPGNGLILTPPPANNCYKYSANITPILVCQNLR